MLKSTHRCFFVLWALAAWPIFAVGCDEVHRPAALDSGSPDTDAPSPVDALPDGSDAETAEDAAKDGTDGGMDAGADVDTSELLDSVDVAPDATTDTVGDDDALSGGELGSDGGVTDAGLETDEGPGDAIGDGDAMGDGDAIGDGADNGDGVDATDTSSSVGSFYCVGYAGLFMRSDDLGKTWEVLEDQGSGGDDPTLYRNIHYLNGAYFRVGNAGRGFWVSTDGETWVDYSEGSGVANQWVGGVAYGNGRWVAAGGCGITFTSLDAVNWDFVYNAPDQPGCEHARTIAFGGGSFVTIGNNGSSAYSATTTDGATFSNYQQTDAYGWHSVVYAFGRFWAALADGSAVMTSTDGASFQAQTGLPDHSYRRVSFEEGRLLISTSSGVLLESVDGESFSAIDGPTMTRVAFGDGVYLGPGSGGALHRSDDAGVTWSNVNPTTHSVQRCIYAP